jgi:hypothetical protein
MYYRKTITFSKVIIKFCSTKVCNKCELINRVLKRQANENGSSQPVIMQEGFETGLRLTVSN